jgi:hypothetical protein
MSDGISMGENEASGEGIEVPGGELDPLGDLIAWTDEVSALNRASAVFPSLEPVVQDNGYTGPSADVLTSYGGCWLLCGSRANAERVFHYLEDHAEALDLVPDMERDKALIYVHARRPNRKP